MIEYEQERSFSFLKPVVADWVSRIEHAHKTKQPFKEIADQCMGFFSRACGFMWDQSFRSKYLGNIDAPQFKVTVAKAFELVAIFGPMLYWRYPSRNIRAIKTTPNIPPEYFQMKFGETGEAIYQQMMQANQAEELESDIRNQLLGNYLDYSQREQPGGGLAKHSEMAITEALVKGRGCLWAESYKYPGSQREITGCFYDSVDNLFIDPDAECPLLSDAKWIARKHVNHYWEVERRFGYPKDYLKHKAHLESGESQATRNGVWSRIDRQTGDTNDLMVWYEIWSKGGAVSRNKKEDPEFGGTLDEIVGDYAYICVSNGLDHPLNATSRRVSMAYDDEVREMFSWPVPYYVDDKWPVALLDFYHQPNSPWPIAPMAPGLGELVCLNILSSSFVEQAYENRKIVIGVVEEAAAKLEEALKSSDNPVIVRLKSSLGHTIDKMVQFLQRPPMNKDLIAAIDYMSMMFDKRTGLSEVLYAMNPGGVQSRSSRDAASKEEKASIRPQKMSKDVAKWQCIAGDLEKLCAYFTLTGEDVKPLVGRVGGQLWEQLITSVDPETIARETRCEVDAKDHEKPNRERELANLTNMSGYVLPEMSKHADVTGDTRPMNAFLKRMGESMEMSVEDMLMGPRQPPEGEDPAQQLEFQKMQGEVEKTQYEVEGKKLDNIGKRLELEGNVDIEKEQMKMHLEAQKAAQQMQAAQAKSVEDLEAQRAKNDEALDFQREKNQLALEAQEQAARIKAQEDNSANRNSE